MHLHHLHDWLLQFDIIAELIAHHGALDVLPRWTPLSWYPQRLGVLEAVLPLLDLVVVELGDVVYLLLLNLVVLLLVARRELIQVDVSTVQEGVGVGAWGLLVAEVGAILFARASLVVVVAGHQVVLLHQVLLLFGELGALLTVRVL